MEPRRSPPRTMMSRAVPCTTMLPAVPKVSSVMAPCGSPTVMPATVPVTVMLRTSKLAVSSVLAVSPVR